MILEQADYSFNAATKEVTFNAPYNTIELQQIELIVNVVDNIIIYQFNKNAKGGTLAAGVLTLTYDTTAMSNGDVLMVIVGIAQTSTGLTDAELRATPVPVSGTINTGLTQPLTDTQLRASAVPVIPVSLPLPMGAATEGTLGSIQSDTSAINVNTLNIDTSLNEIESAVYTSGNATIKIVGIGAEESGKIYPLNATTLGGNAVLKVATVDGSGNQVVPLQSGEILASVTTVDTITNVVHIDDNGGSVTVDGAVTVSGTVAVTGAGDATAANQTTEIALLADIKSFTGGLTEVAPATDTASSGLNGRLQRIAQRITSLITALGSPFQAGGSIGNTAFGVNNAAGASAVNIQDGGNSITVDGTVAVSGSVPVTGTFFQATQPVSAVSLPLPTLAATSTIQTDGTQKSIVRGGAKGATTAADVTSTAQSADRQALDVQIRTSAGVVVDTFGGGTQYADGAVRGTATGTMMIGDDGVNAQSVKVDSNGILARNISTPTKTGGNSIITLQSVAASSVLVSSAVDVSTKWKGSLNVFFGRRSATAAGAGVNIYIEGSTFASGDDNWATLAQYTTGFAAAEAEAVTGTVAAGATVITCASTTNLTAQDYIFIDNGTIANSEWRRIKSIVAATSVTVIDALTNAQTGSTMYDSAETYNADLDLSSIMRIRVVADGSLYTQAFAIKVTSTYLDSIV